MDVRDRPRGFQFRSGIGRNSRGSDVVPASFLVSERRGPRGFGETRILNDSIVFGSKSTQETSRIAHALQQRLPAFRMNVLCRFITVPTVQTKSLSSQPLGATNVKSSRRQFGKQLLAGAAAGTILSAGVSASASKDAPEERIKTKVCVIGGGSGGVGAALAAARGGADTVSDRM